MTLETEQRGGGWRKEGSTWIKRVDPEIVKQMPPPGSKTFIERSWFEVLKEEWRKFWSF